MSIFRRLVRRRSDGTFTQSFPDFVVDLLVQLAEQLDEVVDSDSPDVQRLFPTAYPHDPEKDAGYQILARDELVEGRRQAIATVRRTAEQQVLSEEELMDWMAVTNDLRLVIGTRLDVSEDDPMLNSEDGDTPEAQLRQVYELLGGVLNEIVDGLSKALPD